MTTLESLKQINPYPIPSKTIQALALKRGLDLAQEANQNVVLSAAYRLCEADLYCFLSTAPDVTQQGISYKFTDEDKKRFLSIANNIYTDLGDSSAPAKTVKYGYKGSNL
jgi:hypothetical protein